MNVMNDFLGKSSILIQWWKWTLSFSFVAGMILMSLIGGSLYWDVQKLWNSENLSSELRKEVNWVVMGVGGILLLFLLVDIIQSIRVSFSVSKLLKIAVEKKMKRFLVHSRMFLLLMMITWIAPFFTGLSSITAAIAGLSILLKFLYYRNDSCIRKLKASADVTSSDSI
ncbi:hypothetical protein HF1_01370 [Mycoplasma haemofelis str. Langford 1]|uniref:Transmembrane protein n=1 Tax=Mycoplasma haemofelis (strain Langford 1) TaxID=941640 RepID=E8ZKH9_MYCHL|nr:hypothetical protein [Mycoplasma haemofelis]CBY92145.1 hypothetical protein HF1_01370 [Mycoplasma haemofelis str. Langford 1]